jgi:hypothetical protein
MFIDTWRPQRSSNWQQGSTRSLTADAITLIYRLSTDNFFQPSECDISDVANGRQKVNQTAGWNWMRSRPRQILRNQKEDPIIKGIYSLHLTGNYPSYRHVRRTQTRSIGHTHQKNHSSWLAGRISRQQKQEIEAKICNAQESARERVQFRCA